MLNTTYLPRESRELRRQTTQQEIIELVQRYQGHMNLTQYAVKLGVSTGYLSKFYKLQIPPGLKLISGMMKQFPESIPELITFLRSA